MIRIAAATVIGVALAAALSFAGASVATATNTTSEPVNESLYNYGDR